MKGFSDRVGDTEDENILEDTFLIQDLENGLLKGTYHLPSFTYCYFRQDAADYTTAFANGFYLQFLPGTTLADFYDYSYTRLASAAFSLTQSAEQLFISQI